MKRTSTRFLVTRFAVLLLSVATPVIAAHGPPQAAIRLESSNPKLEKAFEWAVAKATSYVQTGKAGPVDGHERNRPGTGSVRYVPSYWAGYTWRTAFYSRDYCHQATGAHLLGLQEENLTMLRSFAASATPERKWYPLWALNFDGSPFKLDYAGDDLFVREVPAVFELVEQCHRQYRWTGNPAYKTDPILLNYCEKALTDFIQLHDFRIPNGVPEGDGSGDIFRGSATYNEIRAPLVEAGDGIGSQYQALVAYSQLLAARGERKKSKLFARRAAELKRYFNTQWGVTNNSTRYIRGYNVHGQALTDFGLENSWFMPMKLITEPSPRTDAYLEFISQAVDSPKTRPSNLEAVSYLPDVFFPYNRREEAWKWMEYIIDQPNREYPEISFTLISHVVEGLLGFAPDAAEATFRTTGRLPGAVERVKVQSIRMGDHRVDVEHQGNRRSVATHRSGGENLVWQAGFYGSHRSIVVNGKSRKAKAVMINGVAASLVTVKLRPGESATAEVRL